MFNAQPFAAGIGSSFNADSVALSSDRTSRDTVKILNEVKSPLIQMSEFFSGIDSGIIKLVEIAKKSLGLDKASLQLERQIADIMASDLALDEKRNLTAQLRGRDANLAGQDTDIEPGEKPEQLNFVDSLKKAFDDLTSNQTASELLKIFALSLGAFALAKFALKFKDEFSDILKFIKKTLLPEFKELNDDIESYQGLGGLSKLKLFAKMGGALGALTFGITRFIIDPFNKIAKRIKGARLGLAMRIELFKQGGFFKSFSDFFKGIMPRIKQLTTAFKNALSGFSKLSGINLLLKIGGLFLRFIAWPLQLVIGLFGGLTAGLKKYKEGGGMFEVLGAFMVGVYDAIIGSTLNLLADIAGFIVKKLGFENIGQSIQDMDFSFDSIITGIENLKNSISDYFYNLIGRLRNKVPKALGGTKGDVFVPRYTEKKVSKAQAKQMTAGDSLPPSMRGGEESADGFYQRKGRIDVIPLGDIDTNAISGKIDEFNSQDLVLDTKTSNMLAKNKELIAESRRLDAEIKEPAKGNNVYMDNKQVTGGTTVNNSKTFASNQRVESTDRATRELNNVYGYALA
jgi:hypothetical protein